MPKYYLKYGKYKMDRKISFEQAKLARDRWVEIHGDPGAIPYNKFHDFLGLNQRGANYNEDRIYTLPDTVASRIEALCSPHWRTLLKAIEIKNGRKK